MREPETRTVDLAHIHAKLESLDAHFFHIMRHLDGSTQTSDRTRTEITNDLRRLDRAVTDLWRALGEGMARQDRIREALIRRLGGWVIYLLAGLVGALVSVSSGENSLIATWWGFIAL